MLKLNIDHLLKPQFDWYQATVKSSLQDVLKLMEPLTHGSDIRSDSPKLKNYDQCYRMGGTGGSLMIHHGGTNGRNYGPNVQGTGPLSPAVADLLRNSGFKHSVGRADVCIDFLGDFDQCHSAFVSRCNDARMASRDNGSSKGSVAQLGRTVYGGSVSSSYRPTCYEKGLQLGEGYPANYLRLEHRFMLSKASEKETLSTLSPIEICGLRPVARHLTQSLAGLAIAPYKLSSLPKPKDPYYWMLEAYGRVLSEMKDDHGSWEAVGLQLGYDLDEKAIKNRIRA